MNDILYSLSSPFTKAANDGAPAPFFFFFFSNSPAPIYKCSKCLDVDKFDITMASLSLNSANS